MNSNKHFHLLLPIWGKAYSELFSEVCLPMLLTPGNLGVFGHRNSDQVVILTTWEDRLSIQDSTYFKRLKNLISVEFVLIDGVLELDNSHKAMSECYAMAMRREAVVPGETCFLFLTPDSFWPDGTFQRVMELVDEDFKVVMVGGLRVKSETMSATLRDRIALSPDNPAIPLPKLISLALANIHQMSTAFNVLSNSGFLSDWPSHIYWINTQDHQFIAHCFHLHPLMVVAQKSETAIGTTIDGEFLNNLDYPLVSYHIIQDLAAIELTPSERNWGIPLEPLSIRKIFRFSLLYANSRHWYFFSKRIVLNGSPGIPIHPLIKNLVDMTVKQIEKNKSLALFIQILRLHKMFFAYNMTDRFLKRILKRILNRLAAR